jgi:hypothetical protein
MGLMLCGLLVACASARPSQKEELEAVAEGLTTWERECVETSVLALCDSEMRCELFWCRAVAPSLVAGQWPRSPEEGRVFLPTRTLSGIFFTRGAGRAGGSTRLEAPGAEGIHVFHGHDVVQKLVHLQKPGDVAAWWASEPRAHPEQWLHPLSSWESGYLQAMVSPTVPASLRMRSPVEPEQLTAQEAREAEQLVGTGAAAARKYAHFENRRRIVAHYVLTHPATLRLQLGLYGLVRDSNPLHFALERGWQVVRGEEMFTEQDVSRLGAAAEFFAALAVGVAVEKALGLTHPMAVRGSPAPPYLTPEVERAFVETVRLRAVHMVEVLTNQERGPVLTGVLDTRMGRTFFGVNQAKPPPDLHPLLRKNLDDYLAITGGITPARAGKPGTHSEIVALNRALHEREAALGRPVEPLELSEFVLHNRSLMGKTKIEGIPPPCANCEAILPSGIRILP